MTLSQIIAQALRQLDEDAEDVSEYEERFTFLAAAIAAKHPASPPPKTRISESTVSVCPNSSG